MPEEYFPLDGGVDFVTPANRRTGGLLLDCINYECSIYGGISRIEGFERFDGRDKPSEAANSTDQETRRSAIGVVPGSGDILGIWYFKGKAYAIRNNSGGTAAILHVESGSGWAEVTMSEKLSFDAGTRAFTVGETLTGGTSTATATIGAVIITSGYWGDRLYFDGGKAEFTVGSTVTGGTSSATATILEVVVAYGSWVEQNALGYLVIENIASGPFVDNEDITDAVIGQAVADGGNVNRANAAGYLVLNSVTNGPFQNNEAITDGATGSATADGVNAALTLPAGGRYEFINYNFYGASNLAKMFFVNGVGKAWSFDGTSTVEITTGMTTDTPNHIIAHKGRLWLSFPGGSIQYSSTTDPYSFDPIVGAGEIGLGDDCVGFSIVPGDSLSAYSRNSTHIFQGSPNTSSFVINRQAGNSGAVEWSLQEMSGAIYCDDRGVTSLQATDTYGDFNNNVISRLVTPYLEPRIDNISASTIVRDKNQYRLFFDDGTALFFTFSMEGLKGITIINYGKEVVATCSSEESDGREVLFFGSTDGYVYQADSGTNFDGSEVLAYFRTSYYQYGTPNKNKRFRRITFQVDSESATSSFAFSPDFSYAEVSLPTPSSMADTLEGGGTTWSSGSIWGTFRWSGPIVGEIDFYIDGNGRNMGLLVSTEHTYEPIHTFNGAIVDFSIFNRRR